MGKKLIIKGADFSAVAVDTLLTLDSIAWEGKTYREIFETNNEYGITPGFESGDYSPLVVGSGTPIVTSEVADSGVYSLKIFGNSSQQIKTTQSAATNVKYLLAARVRCDRYVRGSIGAVLYAGGAYLERITNGFETVCNDYTTSYATPLLFVGSLNSANLDGYVDTPVAVISTYFTNVPTVEQFTQLYEQYVAIKKGA